MAIATWFLWIRTKMILSFALHGDWFHDLSQDPILEAAQISQGLSICAEPVP